MARGTTKRSILVGVLGASAMLLGAGSSWADGATQANHVRDVKVRVSDAQTGASEIEIQGSATPVYNMRVENAGKRLVVDITGADVAGAKEAVTSAVGVVGGILTQAFKTDAGMLTRVTVSLNKPAAYRIRPDGDILRLTLTPGKATEPAAAPKEEPVVVTQPVEAAKASSLVDVKYVHAKGQCTSGCDKVIIATTEVPGYALTTAAGGKVRLELKKTDIAKDLQKTLDVSAGNGLIHAVTTSYDPQTNTSFVDIDREVSLGQGSVSVEGKNLVWAFDAQSKKVAPIRRSRTVAREHDGSADVKIETSILGDAPPANAEVQQGSEVAGFTATLNAQAARGYSGRRIDLDLKDADIHNILRLLADVGRVNIVTADDVSGNVTIRMKNVPWDQALDVVLQAKALGMVRAGNLIRVAPLALLQKERELRLAAAKQEYELTPLETRLIPVSYATADELQARSKDLLSPRGTIAVDERTNILIARDISGNLNNIEELVRQLDTQTPQVLVEARIVEATSRYSRDIGIQWGGDTSFSQATGNPTGIAFPSSIVASGGAYDAQTNSRGLSPFQNNVAQPNFAVNLPAAVGAGQGGAVGFSLGSIDNNLNIGIRLSAAEASGLVRIVSSPRILTLDNRDARISQGTLIPFSQISAQGVQTTFQEAKLQLLVKPHVTADGSIAMHLKINRDEPDFTQTSARGDPTILKREAETDLLVMDGHTAVIGGIFTRNTGRNLDQVPFFGDIPILGVLFQRRRASDVRNELVIFITPRIVNRAEALGR